MPRVKVHDEQLRRRLVDEAGRLVVEDGVAALTLRRLATEAGTSTTAVYSLFGDKDALLDALAREGFERLGARLRAAGPAPDPLSALAEVGRAYRAAALASPHLYALQFGQLAVRARGREAVAAAARAHAPLLEAVQACVGAGVLVGAPEDVARHLWAVAHGMVSLELADLWPGGEAAYEAGLGHSVAAFWPS